MAFQSEGYRWLRLCGSVGQAVSSARLLPQGPLARNQRTGQRLWRIRFEPVLLVCFVVFERRVADHMPIEISIGRRTVVEIQHAVAARLARRLQTKRESPLVAFFTSLQHLIRHTFAGTKRGRP